MTQFYSSSTISREQFQSYPCILWYLFFWDTSGLMSLLPFPYPNYVTLSEIPERYVVGTRFWTTSGGQPWR